MRMKPTNPFCKIYFTKFNGILNFLLLLLFIIEISADGCNRGCPRSDSGKLKYSPGIGYQYKFDSVVTIGVQNTESEETGLKLNGDAILYYEGNCAYTLNLDNVNVQTIDTTNDKFNKNMLKNDFNKPIQFTMIDGELETQICGELNDNEYSLNIKRGIVSMLQYTDNKYETDIFGVCPTETTTTIQDTTQIITKLRNLNLCNYRENIMAYYATGIINEKSQLKNRPFVNGDYVKEQKLINGIYESIKLIETYNSQHQTQSILEGATTKISSSTTASGSSATTTSSVYWIKVISNLNLKQQLQQQQPPQINNKKTQSIIFEQTNPNKNGGIKNLAVLKKIFDETVNLLQDYTKADSAQHFSELIRLMRHSDLTTLIELSAIAQNNDLSHKVYFDALIRTGTAQSIKAIVKQINKWTDKEKKLAYLSLVMAHSIDLDALNSVTTLLTPESGREAYLSIGTLVNLYCKKNSCNNGELNTITQKYISALRNCKANTKKDEDHIVSVLKGLRNIKQISDTIIPQLQKCSAKENSARIRVAAIQSFVASSCNEKLQNYAIQILRDRNEDSEIRIEAYLIAVNCPNAKISNDISDIINTETVNQVGGFITSHLKAIRDTTDFTKFEQKKFLENIRIIKKFPIDPKRFSFNNDLSYSIDALGLGAGIDYTVIYSQNGFLPRSVRLNLTNEAYGTSFNTFEFNMRQENMENILEHFFGPKGFFNQEPKKIIDEVNNYVGGGGGSSASNRINRSKRDLKDDVNTKYQSYNTKSQSQDDINLDLSMKIFGSELSFLSIGDQIPSNTDELSNLLKTIFYEFKNGIKNYNKKWQYHTLLHDIEIVYPTGFGLPLEFAIKSSATGKLDFGIELDFDKLIENYKNTKYHLKLIPNQDINFETFIRINSGIVKTGIRTSSNLHTANGGDIKIDFIKDDSNSMGFNVDLKLPRQNVELIEFKHNIDYFVAELDKELKIIQFKQNKKRKTYQPICFDQLEMFGLTVCYTANLPIDNTDLTISTNKDKNTNSNSNSNINNKLPLLFNGPIQVSLILHTEKNIQLQGRYKLTNDYQNWLFTFDTPGSSDSHKTELQLKLGVQPKLFARIDFINPKKRLAGETGLINNDKELIVYGQIEIDNDKSIQKIGFTKNNNEYKPIIEMKHGNQIQNDLAGYKIDGKIVVERGGGGTDTIETYKFNNLRIITPENKENIINGWLEYYGQLKGFKSELNLKRTNNKLYKIDSHFKRGGGDALTGGTNFDLSQYSISAGAFITEDNNPETKIGGSILLEHSKQNLKHDIKLQTGIYYLNFNNELITKNLDDNKIDESNAERKFINNFEIKNIKDNSIIIMGKLNGDITKKLLHIDFEGKRLDKIISTNLHVLRNQRVPGDLNLDLKTKLNRHTLQLQLKLDINDGKLIIDKQLITSWGTQLTVKGELNQNYQNDLQLIDLNGKFKLNNNDKENTFIIKFTNIQDKINSEFKLSRDNLELISYNGEIQIQQDKQNGVIKLIIKDNLNLNGKYNINIKNGRGDFNGLLHIKKATTKPIKINSKFLYLLPKFNMDTTIQWDDKKIQYKTENELNKLKFLTKNLLEIGTEKIQFDFTNKIIQQQQQHDGGGTTTTTTATDNNIVSEFLLILPTERKLTGKLTRQIDNKTKVKTLNINVIDTQPDTKSRSIELINTISDVDRLNALFNINTKLIYNNLMDKNLQLILNIKNLLKNQQENNYKTANLYIELSGTQLQQTPNTNENDKFIFNLNLNEYSKQHCVYTLKTNYGNKIETNLNGFYNIKTTAVPTTGAAATTTTAAVLPTINDITVTYELDGNIKSSISTDYKKFVIKTNGKYNVNYDKTISRDIDLKLNYQLNDNAEKSGDYNIKLNGDINNGKYNIKLNCPKYGKNIINGEWQRDIKTTTTTTGTTGTTNSNSGKLQYITHIELEKFINSDIKLQLDYDENNEINLHYTITTTYDKLQKFDLIVNAKNHLNDNINNKYITVIKLNYNNDIYIINTETLYGEHKNGVNFSIQTPQKQSKLIAIYDKLQQNHIKGELQLTNIFDLDVESNGELKYNTIDDFYIIYYINSNKLKLNKIKGTLKSDNKLINIIVNSDQQILLNGAAQYNIKNEKQTNKIIIEGRGDITYKNDKGIQQKNLLSFKLIRQLYVIDNEQNEYGFQYTFNGEYGPKNFVSTLKMTNKNFIIKLTGCEESKQCTNFEIQSVIQQQQQQPQQQQQQQSNDLITTATNLNLIHELMILIDLRELGYPHEFELQSKTTKLGFKVNHDFEIQITSNNNKKYKFLANIKPNMNSIQLQLPKRIILLEIENQLPFSNAFDNQKSSTSQQLQSIFGKYKNSIKFYFDKLNRPTEVAQLELSYDLSGIKQQTLNADFEFILQNPYLEKPLTIRGAASADHIKKTANANININVFKTDEHKIIGEVKVSAAAGAAPESTGDTQTTNRFMIFNYLAESKFASQGLGFNYKAKALAKLNLHESEIHLESSAESSTDQDLKFLSKLYGKKDKLDIQLIGFNQPIINMKMTYDSQKYLLKTDSTYQLISSKPIKFISEISPIKIKLILKRDNLLNALAEYNIGKDAKLQLNKGNDNQKQILNGKLSLEPQTFLTTTYDVNEVEFKDLMKLAEEELIRDTNSAKAKLNDKYKKSTNVISERLKKLKDSLPDVTALKNNYATNIKSIIKELEEDATLKKFFTDIRQLYEKLIVIVQDFSDKTTELYKKIEIAVIEFYDKQQKLFNETIVPALNDLNKKLNDIVSEFYQETIKIIRSVFDRVQKSWKIFEQDLKDFAKPIYDIIKPFNDILNDLIKQLTKELKDIINDAKEYINKLPIILNDIWMKLNKEFIKLYNIDEILIILRDIFQQLEIYTTSNEGKEFLNKLYNYIEVKLMNINKDNNNNQDNKINDIEELESLYYSLIQAINAFIIQLTGDNRLNTATNTNDIKTNLLQYYQTIIQPITFSYDTISKLPILLTFKLSPLNYLRNENLNSITDLIVTNIPNIIIDILPPYQLYSHIADGKNLFTFDGRLIVLPDDVTCKYILAQDSVNNNFTIIGNFVNSKLQSIIVVDKEQKYLIEIDNNGQLKLNDKKIEYPIHVNDYVSVWRRYYTITILNQYGCMVKCSLDLRVCHITVNGFYTSKLRGLLGNGNSEQYDDIKLPNGNILDTTLYNDGATNIAEFLNQYNLNNKKCTQIQQQQLNNIYALQQQIEQQQQQQQQLQSLELATTLLNNNNNDVSSTTTTTSASSSTSICNELFDINSSLLFGYIFVDRKPYRNACNINVKLNKNQNNLNELNDIACNIALTYASAVQDNKNIQINLPAKCIKCSDNNQNIINFNDEYNVKIPTTKSDILILLDTTNLTTSNTDLINDLIQPIINNLKTQLKSRNLIDQNYIIISYNNKQIYPNILTTNGKLNFNGKLSDAQLNDGPKYDDNDFLTDLTNFFTQKTTKLYDIIEKLKELHEPIQTEYKAIKLAFDYPYRSDAAKSILLIKNDESKYKMLDFVGTPILNYLFKTKGVSVNYLGNVNDLTIDGKPSEKLVGFNKRAVAFFNGLGKRQKLEYASNPLIDTLVDDESWIFSLNNFKAIKSPEHKKSFALQVSTMIADQLFKTEITSNCVCSLKYGLHGETTCTKESSEHIPTKKITSQKQG